ncbi:MAG: phage portal protein [Lachnospiraceae bacterium]|nr:phage portal protein [Lachnospiraceae bacterium]
MGTGQYDDIGEYISFIEHWTDAYTAITYWDVYYPNYVEHWNNEDGVEHLVSTERSVGLPIHYHNFNDEDYNFGLSMLVDIKPIMDDLEDIMSKLGDAIYVNTLNPMPVATGQRIESSIPADATGYVLNLDVGDFKYANCNIDYNTIKLYLDNMKQFLNDVASIPSVLGSNTNIANISEVSMQILLMMASVLSDENKKWLNIGFKERFKRFQKILNMQGISAESDVDVIYNVSMPVASTEMVANLKALQEMGAISRETIMEKSEIITDVDVEKKRLEGEEQLSQKSTETVKDKTKPSD